MGELSDDLGRCLETAQCDAALAARAACACEEGRLREAKHVLLNQRSSCSTTCTTNSEASTRSITCCTAWAALMHRRWRGQQRSRPRRRAPEAAKGRTMSDRVLGILADSFVQILIPGLTATIPLALISFVLALGIAVVVALVQYARIPVLRQLARLYIWIIRGTPLLIQLYVVFYGLPDLGITLDPWPSAIIVFSINTGAYSAETIRGALESVPAGQLEAGYCVGMTYLQVMRRIVLPQALRTAFPPLSNELISLVKDTSLAANITVLEMLMATQRIVSRTYEALPLYLEVGVIYLIFSTALTWLQGWGERALARRGMERG